MASPIRTTTRTTRTTRFTPVARGPYSTHAPRAARALIALILTLALLPTFAGAWGNSGHTYINQDAAEKIPADMPAFLRTKAAIARIAYLGPEPDRWRGGFVYALNESQAPDHFIDLDRLPELGIAKPTDLPHGRYEFIKIAYEKRAQFLAGVKNPADREAVATADSYLPDRIGFQPYITIEIFDRLKAAFRAYRELQKAGRPTDAVEQDIIFYAGWLGHYVGDGSMPLHTSSQYDGWHGPNPNGYTTQKGIHARFETDFVDRNITAASFAQMLHAPVDQPSDIALGSPNNSALNAPPSSPVPAIAAASNNAPAGNASGADNDPFHAYLDYLSASNRQIERVYALDKSRAFDGAGTAEGLQFTKERLAAGAQMLLNLWHTAWVDSAE